MGPNDETPLPESFWVSPDIAQVLRTCDIPGIIQAVRKARGWTQAQIGQVLGYSQAWVSKVMAGSQPVTVDQARQILRRLDVPLHLVRLNEQQRGGEDPTKRRDLLKSTALASLALPGELALDGLPGPVAARHVGQARSDTTRLSRVLLGYGQSDFPTSTPTDLPVLRQGVDNAKAHYQECRYTAVQEQLPALIAALDHSRQLFDGDAALARYALVAEAHHVTASVLFKRGDQGLAWVAADRSMQAAQASRDPLMIGSSARILTHAFMSGGIAYLREAAAVASAAATTLDARTQEPSPESLSVYGALLLRGAIAAARQGNRAATVEFLDEAETAGSRLGGDHNHMWSGFGPTNVLLHRVNTSIALGDAGTAIGYARRIDPTRVGLVERRAALHIDTARAFYQWGKYSQAYRALRAAEHIAPEEVGSTARRLVGDVLVHAPPSIFADVRDLASRVGVAE